FEEAVETVELAVHENAERLKRARRRIDSHESAARDRAADNRRELTGGRDRRGAPRLDDGARDPPREALFAVLKNRVRQIAFIGARDDIRRRFAGGAIHPHIERLVALETEPPTRRIELQRRDPEVGERAV